MDHGSARKKQKNPWEGANYFSILTFWWILPIMRKCKKYFKSLEDFFPPPKEDSSALLGDQLERVWKNEILEAKKNNRKPSLLRALISVHLKSIITNGILQSFTEFILRLGFSVCLIPFINYFESDMNVSENIFKLAAAGLILTPFSMVFLINLFHLESFHIGMKLRVAVCSLIYRKVLNSNKAELSDISTGFVVNLLSNDASRFDYIITFFHDTWIGPIQISLVFIFLWYYIGVSCVVGLVTILFGIPIAAWVGKKTSEMRLKIALKTDDRILLMNEIILGIKIIKLYTWEKFFEKLVAFVRRKEIKIIRKLSYFKSVLFSLPMFHTRLAIFLTILTYILLGNEITASKVFLITSFFNVLHLTVTEYFTYGISQVSEFYTSVKRIEKFLTQGNTLELISSKENGDELNSSNYRDIKGIFLTDVSVSWNKDGPIVLNNINLQVKSEELTIIIGPVGSGKTALIYAILKELVISSGSITVNGSISFASQEPWLFGGTVKQNILFGEKYSEERFKMVLKACALEVDIESFIYKEETLVGERGVTLSGGQKARINLARAVYRDVDIYLLDDPLSAVDADVQKQLFKNCITGILKNKVVILATHQLQFLSYASQIIFMEKGKIRQIGGYGELANVGMNFSKFMDKISDGKEAVQTDGGESNQISSSESEIKMEEKKRVMQEELMNKNIKWNVLSKYFTIGNKWELLLFFFLLSVLSQMTATGGDYWISHWLILEERGLLRNTTDLSNILMDSFYNYPTRNLCIYILGVFILTTMLFALLRSFLFFWVCMKSSVALHDETFKAVSRAPLRFFNDNPSGRILNRFSKDIGNIDETLPSCMIDCLQIILSAVGILVIVPFTNPWFIIPTMIIVVLFYFLRQFYVSSACTIKRFEGIARSPIYTHLSASLQGLITIHALKAEAALKEEFDSHQDNHTSACFTFVAAVRAISLWLDLICVLYNALITLTFVFFGSVFYSGNVGLAITQTSRLTSSLQWGIRQSTEVENQMTSVERILEYSELKQEPLHCSSSKQPCTTWPSKGRLVFKDVCLRYYDEDPLILNGITFTIQPKQKVGIVGRTGAGKSSLIVALCRLFEITGLIEIDGIDTSTVHLSVLRSKISVIPQDVFLFTGTFRYNLDPFDEYSDTLIWEVLQEVELKNLVKSLPGGLQSKIYEGGSNLSVGQCQLLSLARAILRGNKILILDEATANVDLKTDEIIQKTIRKKFIDCTVLTIAHRLSSIIDSDLVMVMDKGYLVELDHPHILLQNKSGIFHSLTEQSGFFLELSKMAEEVNIQNLISVSPYYDT